MKNDLITDHDPTVQRDRLKHGRTAIMALAANRYYGPSSKRGIDVATSMSISIDIDRMLC